MVVNPDTGRHVLGWEFAFCSLVDEIARLQKVVTGQQMKRYCITQVQWVALVYLARADGMRQVDLQVELGITRGGCTHLVNRLQKAGWLDCRPDGQDGRVNRLFITESAKRVLGKIQIVAEHIHRDIFQNILQADGLAAMETLAKVRERLVALNGGSILE
jgi:DNA-binding MarR family transcriptional regulator